MGIFSVSISAVLMALLAGVVQGEEVPSAGLKGRTSVTIESNVKPLAIYIDKTLMGSDGVAIPLKEGENLLEVTGRGFVSRRLRLSATENVQSLAVNLLQKPASEAYTPLDFLQFNAPSFFLAFYGDRNVAVRIHMGRQRYNHRFFKNTGAYR